jgi:hypothetical protein
LSWPGFGAILQRATWSVRFALLMLRRPKRLALKSGKSSLAPFEYFRLTF